MNVQSLLDLTLGVAYITIPGSGFRYIRRIPKRIYPAVTLGTLFSLSCGIGRILRGLDLHHEAYLWSFATTSTAVVTVVFVYKQVSSLVDYLSLGDLILKHSPSGIGIFEIVKNKRGDEDLLWVERSESALLDVGFDPTVRPTLLGETQPNHQEDLLADYIAIAKSGKPVLNRKIHYVNDVTKVDNHYIQSLVPIRDRYDNAPDKLMIVWSNITQLVLAQRLIEHKAETDELTGIWNRRALSKLNSDNYTGCAFIDLDRFKVVNDTLGHEVGDQLLRAVVQRLKILIGEQDRLFRVGGDEFLVVFSDPDRISDQVSKAELIIRELKTPFWIKNREICVGASAGVADRSAMSITKGSNVIQGMVRAADIAMYKAKTSGGGVQAWDIELVSEVSHTESIELSLRSAKHKYDDEFSLVYQPIVALDNPDKIVSVEALIRWTSSDLGWVSPGEFIPIAENSGDIIDITRWVVDTALQQSAWWGHQLQIAINVSPWDLETSGFTEHLQKACVRNRAPLDIISLEVTERSISVNTEVYLDVLKTLSEELKVSIKMDDFGVGDSGLQQLISLPIDTIKIDRSLIPRNESEVSKMRLCAAISNLCRNDLGLKIIAEGVETVEQVALLQSLEVTYGQGFYFSRPVPPEEIDLTRV